MILGAIQFLWIAGGMVLLNLLLWRSQSFSATSPNYQVLGRAQ